MGCPQAWSMDWGSVFFSTTIVLLQGTKLWAYFLIWFVISLLEVVEHFFTKGSTADDIQQWNKKSNYRIYSKKHPTSNKRPPRPLPPPNPTPFLLPMRHFPEDRVFFGDRVFIQKPYFVTSLHFVMTIFSIINILHLLKMLASNKRPPSRSKNLASAQGS